MSALIATLLCACAIAGLLYLNREQPARASMALWIPGLWIGVVGSRSLTEWLGSQPTGNVQLEGSPLDAALYGALLAMALFVLVRRRNRAQILLFDNRAILLYFLYCLVSVTWSYYPDVALKRWIKAIGDIAIVLVIATEDDPVAAIRRLVSRIGFVLLPLSVLFIKYYGDLGRAYGADGMLMNTGVSTNKNSLGLTVLVVSLIAVWNLRFLFAHKHEPSRGRRLVAQSVLLAFGVALLWIADSSTCKACFFLGSFLMVASGLRAIKERPARIHALCAAILAVAGITFLLGGQDSVIAALGRQANMSGRTDIWAAVIAAVPNSIVGAGFEGFWLSPSVQSFRQELLDLGWYPPLVEVLNEAHNGYIETYLNLGWIGVCLIAAILIAGYRKSVAAFQQDPELGGMILAFVSVAVIYSITEAGFRMLNPAWIFLLLVMVCASGVTTGLFGISESSLTPSRPDRASQVKGLDRDLKARAPTAHKYLHRQERSH